MWKVYVWWLHIQFGQSYGCNHGMNKIFVRSTQHRISPLHKILFNLSDLISLTSINPPHQHLNVWHHCVSCKAKTWQKMTRFDIQLNSLYLFTSRATLLKQPCILRRRTTELRAKRSFLRSLWFFRVSSQSPPLFSPVLRVTQQPVKNVSTDRRRSQRSMLEKGNFTLKVTNYLATSCRLPYGTNIAHPTARPHARCKKESGKRYWSHT
jgi:hypothetical protein